MALQRHEFPIGGIAHELWSPGLPEGRAPANGKPFDSKSMIRCNSGADSYSLDRRRM
jgi:hypothetical protein